MCCAMSLEKMESQLKVKIARNATVSTHAFTDFFKGFERVEAVRRIFGDETEHVLSNLRVEFFGRRGYMGVSDEDGHLMVSAYYLNCGDYADLYLDVVHELVHVKQFMEGKELFDDHYSYVDRPTEIEAYRHTVEEARRIGLTDEDIVEYLRTEWMTAEDVKKLAKTLGINCIETAVAKPEKSFEKRRRR